MKDIPSTGLKHRFESLGVERSRSLDACALAKTFTEARDLFNSAMKQFNEAMQVYTLEAWFSECGHFAASFVSLGPKL